MVEERSCRNTLVTRTLPGGLSQRSSLPLGSLLCGVLLMIGLPQGTARGFVLPGPFVLARCQERLAGLRGLEVVLEVDDDGQAPFLETMRFDAQGRLQYAVERPRTGVRTLRRLLGGGLRALLQELDVDLHRSSLRRQDGRVAVAVGALAKERERAQLWVDQDSFFPMRLVAGGRELILSDLHSPQTGGWFPRLIRVREHGRLLWQARVIRIRYLFDATRDRR